MTKKNLGKYELRRKIGEGAFSTVWRAYDTFEDIFVAIKLPHSNLPQDELLEEFTTEARIAAGLDHPNILGIKTADIIDGQLALVYELGLCSLDKRMQQSLPLSWAMLTIRQILEGLAFAHSRGVVHRDVKPENIILFSGDNFRLADFGVSKSTRKTIITDNPVGTLGYMAPEQAYGKGSFSADTFSVGIIFYQMLTYHLPDWPFKWPFASHKRLVQRGGPELVELIRKATAFDPRDRFKDAGQMLDAFLQCEQVLAAA